MGYPVNGLNPPTGTESMSPDAMIAAVRQQMCNMVDAANFVAGFQLPPNMTIQSMTPSMSSGSSNQISNPKAGSPAMIGQINKNGGESSNILQMPRLGSPALHNLSNDMSSLHGLQNISPSNDDIDFRKRNRMRKEPSGEDDFMNFDEQQKNLINNRLSITKLSSPRNQGKSPSIEALEPAVNLAISGHSLDMSFKSSRTSSDGSVNGEDGSLGSYRSSNVGFKDTNPIKMEPLADCRE